MVVFVVEICEACNETIEILKQYGSSCGESVQGANI